MLIALSCKAQFPVIHIESWNGIPIQNSYVQDNNDILDDYVGTYVHTSGDTIFTFKLRKIETAFTGYHFEDLLIGEYEYKIGNNSLINRLSEFNANYPNQNYHYIHGNRILENLSIPACANCALNEKRVCVLITDKKYPSSFVLKRTTVNGNQALQVFKYTEGPFSKLETDPPLIAIIRDGDFLFIKQP